MNDQPLSLRIPAADGYPLAVRLWDPPAARATVVIHGATAVPQSYYTRFAGHLAAAGLRVVTYDYRGVGDSRPARLRGFDASMTEWGRLDADAILRHARLFLPGPLVLVGHSFGGQLIGLSEEAHRASGAVLVGAQFGYVGHWPALPRARYELVWRALIPAATAAFGYLPGWMGLGTDLPAGVAREWARWCLSPGYLTAHHADARARFARFQRPVLFYSFSDDGYAPAGAVEALLQALPREHVRHLRLRPRDVGAREVGHFGFFRPRFAETLWAQALGFVDEVLGAPTREEEVRRAAGLQ